MSRETKLDKRIDDFLERTRKEAVQRRFNAQKEINQTLWLAAMIAIVTYIAISIIGG